MKVLIILGLALLITLVASEGIQRIGATQPRSIRTTLQACRKDFRQLCLNKGAAPTEGNVAPRTRRGPIQCLTEKMNDIEDAVCKDWVKAEDTCKKASQETGKCSKNMDIRRCLSQVKSDELPTECTQTDFYKNIGVLRKPRRSNKNNNNNNTASA